MIATSKLVPISLGFNIAIGKLSIYNRRQIMPGEEVNEAYSRNTLSPYSLIGLGY